MFYLKTQNQPVIVTVTVESCCSFRLCFSLKLLVNKTATKKEAIIEITRIMLCILFIIQYLK